MLKKGIIAILAGLCVALAILLASALHKVGSVIVKPIRRPIKEPPIELGLNRVEFPSNSGAQLAGWIRLQQGARGGVLLLHGVKADRSSMIDRMRFLIEAGYSVLAFDFQAHGESGGETITMGKLEALDARAAVRYFKAKSPGTPIAAIGSSLGGAACLLGESPLQIDALVVEAVFSDIRVALRNRLRGVLGAFGPPLAPLLLLQMQPRIGVSPDDLVPIRSIGRVQAPILVLGGELDTKTTAKETRRMFNAAPEPKELWLVPGAYHVDLYQHGGKDYKARILEFLSKHLPSDQLPASSK